MNAFDRAGAIADAVLMEGYVLYPYRSCSTKNRYRWTFGVLAPQAWSETGGCEPWWLEAQVLVEGTRPMLRGRLRFLHVRDRRVEAPQAVGAGFRAVDRLDLGEQVFVPWEEGEIREIDFALPVEARTAERRIAWNEPADREIEMIDDGSGGVGGRIVRTRARLDGVIWVGTEVVEGGREPLVRVRVRVENVTAGAYENVERADVMRASCISAHVLLAVDDGRFISLLDPPEHAVAAALSCTSKGAYPVLVGKEGHSDLMLCSPIILYDHPQIAPESPLDFYDATEIDGMLTLRTKTLSPDEKRLARATDPRSAAILDQVDAMDAETMTPLQHGVMRDVAPPRPRFVRGGRVRLFPERGRRRTDAQDLLVSGRTATIEDVRDDVDGREYLLVTIDDDPSVEIYRMKGRYHFYYPDEVEPIDAGEVDEALVADDADNAGDRGSAA